ncbi:hypothetical protein Q31b_34040 [Novipirellula aureliae]|uniref:Uncharacterized protein n=1 Tax=Novipirellula aureliae TaxID=2527966 RepID=A0A5C6DTK4_9BACT|nr:hypothetical protein [Novipirellula aureliae]TWU40060.1 hypothetical protein Q31b_34040 [Novipirellula aureliae]
MTNGLRAPSSKAIAKFHEAALRLRGSTAAFYIWDRVFSLAEKDRLGGDLQEAYSQDGAIRMWARVRGCTDYRAVIDLAQKLNLLSETDHRWLLEEFGELFDADEAFEHAVKHCDFVLNEHTREIFWKGTMVPIDWGKFQSPWSFMWELARHAKANLPIDSMTFGENSGLDLVSKRKSELTNKPVFPQDLAEKIVPVGRGTQKLDLPAEQIRIFERHIGGEIREWSP